MIISIVGTGYVGLVTALSFALLGHKVICVEKDKEKIEAVKSGKAHFYEPGMERPLKKILKNGTISITEDLEEAVLESEIILVAVGTPTIKNKIDLTAIKEVSKQIGKALRKTNKYKVVVIKSTVLPGVTRNVVKPIIEENSGKSIGQFGLCMNPEFLREGSAVLDAIHPDRIVIGQIDEKSGREFSKVYLKVKAPKIFTNLETAEITKYTSNAFFATLISFSNEIARISENVENVDVVDVWKGIHLDRRFKQEGSNTRPGILSYIYSGCGFGGSCFPKDTKALAGFAKEAGIQASLIESVMEINSTQPKRILFLLKKSLGKNLKGKRIAVLGLSFKPNTDDIRESPAFPIIKKLILGGVKVICHDPKVYFKSVPKILKELKVSLAKDVKEAVNNADAALLITSWDEYTKLTPQFFVKNMKHAIVIDGRRIYDKNSFLRAGIKYNGIGLSQL